MTVLLLLLKFHSGPQTLQHHLMLIKLPLGDMPSATRLFQENGNIHLAITVTSRVHMIQKKKFFPPLILYFLSSIFPFYFTLKIAAQISGGPMCVRKTFYLLSAPTMYTSHYAPDMLDKWNDPQKRASRISLSIMWQPLKPQHYQTKTWPCVSLVSYPLVSY